jgi:Ca2+-binding EF-hand superfamily protein
MSWDDFDANRDGMITQDEFSAGLDKSGAWDAWDVNDDRKLSEREVDAAVYRAFDINDSGNWDQAELEAYADYVLGGQGSVGPANFADYAYADEDGRTMSPQEFVAMMDERGRKDFDMDGDGELTADEFQQSVMKAYDRNDSGRLEQNEFESFRRDMS